MWSLSWPCSAFLVLLRLLLPLSASFVNGSLSLHPKPFLWRHPHIPDSTLTFSAEVYRVRFKGSTSTPVYPQRSDAVQNLVDRHIPSFRVHHVCLHLDEHHQFGHEGKWSVGRRGWLRCWCWCWVSVAAFSKFKPPLESHHANPSRRLARLLLLHSAQQRAITIYFFSHFRASLIVSARQ